MRMDALVNDLALLIERHAPTGEEFVAAALRVAEGYFPAEELPPVGDLQEFADHLAAALRDDAR